METHLEDPPSNSKPALRATTLQPRQAGAAVGSTHPAGARTRTHTRRRRHRLRDRSAPKQNSLRLPAFARLAGGRRPGEEAGVERSHHHAQCTAKGSHSSPRRRRGCKYAPADAANRPSITHFTPSPSPQNKTHTQKQKETSQEKPESNSTTISSVFVPRRRLLCPPHIPPRQSGPARCPSGMPCQVPVGQPRRGPSLLI